MDRIFGNEELKLVTYIFLFGAFSLFTLSNGICATITDVGFGSHDSCTLVVISFDKHTPYEEHHDGTLVSISFPNGTKLGPTFESLSELKDVLIDEISYDRTMSRMEIKIKRNYELKIYDDKFPFRIVLDFTHRPGVPKIQQPVDEVENPKISKTKVVTRADPVNSITAAVSDSGKLSKQDRSILSKKESEISISEDSGKNPIYMDSVSLPNEDFEFSMGPIPVNKAFRRGLELKQLGDYRGALEAFLEAVPGVKAQAHYQAALMYKQLDKPKKAIKELSLAINDEPALIPPRIELGRIYQAMGELEKAEQIWEELLLIAQRDTNIEFSQVQSQVDLLSALLSSQEKEINELPPVDKSLLPRIPWIWIIPGLLLVVVIISAKVYHNWRLDQLYESIVAQEEENNEQIPMVESQFSENRDESTKNERSFLQSITEGEEEDEVIDLLGELKTMEVSNGDSNDDKQYRIYALANQNYSISEIARRLDMGQEEVKFILDIRTKTKDRTVNLFG